MNSYRMIRFDKGPTMIVGISKQILLLNLTYIVLLNYQICHMVNGLHNNLIWISHESTECAYQ